MGVKTPKFPTAWRRIMKISIIDYNMGNIKSIKNAVSYLGKEPKVIKNPENLEGEKIIIPGVGAFGKAMEKLEPFESKIKKLVNSETKILGICLGLQAFFESSDEDPGIDGLCLLEGKISKIKTNQNLPHIGWNKISIRNEKCPLLKNVNNPYTYFVHSFHAIPEEKDIVTSTTDYGCEITASIRKGNVFGTQFHPEKSGREGLKILNNFLEL